MPRILGFKVQDITSPSQKQYTVVVSEASKIHVNYGGGRVDGNFTSNPSSYGGAPGANPSIATLRRRARRMLEEYVSRTGGDYQTVLITPRVLEVPANEYTAADTDKKMIRLFTSRDSDTPVVKWDGSIPFGTNAEAICGALFANPTPNAGSPSDTTAAGGRTNRNGEPIPARPARPIPAPAPVNRVLMGSQDAIIRPNGERYIPRFIQDNHDVALLRRLRETSIFARVFGFPGCGKTALVDASFPDCITVVGHGDMTIASFVGTLLPTPTGGWEWSDGPLTQAMKRGVPLFVDEISRIPTEVLAILYSAMDGRGILRIDDRPDVEPVVAQPGFYVVAGYNPDALGTRELDEALISRFQVGIEVTTDYDLCRALGVPTRAIAFAKNLATTDSRDRASGGYGNFVPQVRELLAFKKILDAGLSEEFAVSTLVSSCPKREDMELVLRVAKEIFGREVTPLRTGPAA